MTTSAATTRAARGWETTSHISTPTARSSPKEAAQFEKGSGLALIARRVLALIPCEERAIVPQRSAAAIRHDSETLLKAAKPSTAAAGARMKVCTASHTVSTAGILSAMNSTT